MDKKIAALLGAAAAVTAVGGAIAATQPNPSGPALHASSYADLLAPIPDAVQKLQADDAARAQNAAADVMLAETTVIKSGRQHHHHHHHHNTVIGIPGVGGVTVGSGHHHHHQTTTTTRIQHR